MVGTRGNNLFSPFKKIQSKESWKTWIGLSKNKDWLQFSNVQLKKK